MIDRQSPDEDLADRLRKSHARAFEEIYQRYWSKLYRVAHQQTM